MRRLLASTLAPLFVLALALPAHAGTAAEGSPKIRATPLRIMPVGDSITEGGDGAGGFRKPLYDLIAAATGQAPNFVGGRSMRQSDPADFPDPDQDGYSAYRIEQITTGKGFWNAEPIETRLRDWEPAVVTIHAGTNDAQQDYFFDGSAEKGLPPVIDRLDELVSRIVRFNPDIHILLAQIVPANAPASATTQDYIVRLNALIPGLVAKHQAMGHRVTLVDQYTPMLSHPNPDGIHPDTAGYQVMGQVWFQGLQALGVLPRNPDPGRHYGIRQIDRWSTTSSTPWTLHADNLVRAGAPTLASAVTTGYKGSHPPSLLNDGALGTVSDDSDYLSTTTFTLDTSAAPAGYDITRVLTDGGKPIASNGDEQCAQAYELWVERTTAPGTWTKVGTFQHLMVDRQQRASQVELVAKVAGQPMLRNVSAIQFRFVEPQRRQFGFYGIATGAVYREIEVLGAPSAF